MIGKRSVGLGWCLAHPHGQYHYGADHRLPYFAQWRWPSGRWCNDGNKITQKSTIKEGGTAAPVVILTMEGRTEGRKGWDVGQGNSEGGGAVMIREVTSSQ